MHDQPVKMSLVLWNQSFVFWNMWLLYNLCLIEFLNLSCYSLFWVSILNWIHLWLCFRFMNFWVSGMRPFSPNHFPPLRACCILNVGITPSFPDAPILLALVEILHITKLHVVTASVQFSVCDIFTWVHAHGYGSCLWDHSLSVPMGGSSDELDGRMYVLWNFHLENELAYHLYPPVLEN